VSLAGRFRRAGGKGELRVIGEECIHTACWAPIAVIHGRKEILVCETRVLLGCPSIVDRGEASAAAIRQRRRDWLVV
jgi:hypothetical protein